jgi:Mn2+/Fe2+ NRAMP family transporter
MRITNNREIMGKRTNGAAINFLGWITTAAVSVAAIGLLWTWRR